MVSEVFDGGEEEQEYMVQASPGRVRESDRIITIEQYGYGDHSATLEVLMMDLVRTQSSEVRFQNLLGMMASRCYGRTTTNKPRVIEIIKGGGFEWEPDKGTYEFKKEEKEVEPFYSFYTIFDKDFNRLKKPKPGPPVTDPVEFMVLTPELNQTVVREDIGPDGQYPRWLWFEKNRRYTRSFKRMRRYLQDHPGVSKFQALKVLTEEDEAIKSRKRAQGKPIFEQWRKLSADIKSLAEAYPLELETLDDMKRQAESLWITAYPLVNWDYAPYSVYYPFVGAVGTVPPLDNPMAAASEWIPVDWVYCRAVRLDLVPQGLDPRDAFVLDNGVVKPLMLENGELRPYDGDPAKNNLIGAAQVEISQRARQRFIRTGENKRFGVQEQFPTDLYFNQSKEQYEVYICDLDWKGRTVLAHTDCAADVETQEQVWTLFAETARRKGFNTLNRDEIDKLVDDKEARQRLWADYLNRLDNFVSEFYDRSYPSEQLKESKLLSRVFGAQGWDPKSMSQAKQDLVALAVWIENPPEILWNWDEKKKEWIPQISYKNFRYRARNVERLRKILHRIKSWQSARGVTNRREEASLDAGTLSRYVSNELGGEWEPRPYRQDVRAYYHLRIAKRFAPLDLIKELQPNLDEWEAVVATYENIQNPTAGQTSAFEAQKKAWDEQVETFRYFVRLRHSILDWAWFFKEPWMKMPHDGTLVYTFCETWISQLDIFSKERGLNSAAGDGAFPKWEILVDKFTSTVRNYEDEARWSSTLEMAKRDPNFAWKDLRMILGLYNNLGQVNVRVCSGSTYELWPDLRLNYDNATRGRDFIRLMWRNLPVGPVEETIHHHMEDAENTRIFDTLSIVTHQTDGGSLPTTIVPAGLKPRLGMERMVQHMRKRAVRWIRRRILEKTFLGSARAFSGSAFGSLQDKTGFPYRIGNPELSAYLAGEFGRESWLSGVYDAEIGRAESRDLNFWTLDDERKFQKSAIESRKQNLWYAAGVNPGKNTKKAKIQWLTEILYGLAGYNVKQGTKIAAMIHDEKPWHEIRDQAIRDGRLGQELEVIEEVYLTFHNKPLDVK